LQNEGQQFLLINSLRVEHIPWGAPGITFSVAPLTSFAESSAESAMGTIWSSSPCRMSVGTSIFYRNNGNWQFDDVSYKSAEALPSVPLVK